MAPAVKNATKRDRKDERQVRLNSKFSLPIPLNASLTSLALTSASNSSSLSPTLIGRVRALPQELFDTIIDLSVRAHVHPGRIDFGRSPAPPTPSSLALGDATKSPAFRARTSRILFTENLWVFPAGGLHEAAYLGSVPPASIAAMDLTLHYDDARDFHPGDSLTYYGWKALECRRAGEAVDRAAIGRAYAEDIADWERELATVWIEKVRAVGRLRLGYLRLAFENVLDVGLCMRYFSQMLGGVRFEFGLPPHFEVVAPRESVVRCNEGILRGRCTSDWTRNGTCGFCERGLH